MKAFIHQPLHYIVRILIILSLLLMITTTASADDGALYGNGKIITSKDVTLEFYDAIYEEDFGTPAVKIKGLTKDVDFTVDGIGDVPFPSTYYVTINGIGNYSGQLYIPFYVKMSTPKIEISPDDETGYLCLKWNSGFSATKYEIYRKTSESDYKLYATVEENFFVDADTIPGKRYNYKIKAIDTETPELNSEFGYASGTPKLAKPMLSLQSVKESKSIKLSWTKVDNADAYEIWRKVGSSGTYEKYKTTTKNSFTNTSVIAGKRYYYKIRAIDNENSALNSTFDQKNRICKLPTPTNFKAEYTLDGAVKLSWAPVKGVNRYHVARTTKNNTDSYLVFETTNTSAYDDRVSNKATYYYMVRACSKENWESGSSDYTALVKVKTTIPGPPIVEVFTDTETNDLFLDWSTNFQGKSQLWKATSKDGPYTLIRTSKEKTYTDKNTTTGKTYYYKIRNIDQEDSSIKSPFHYVTATHRLLPVKNLAAVNVPSSGKIKLSWKKRAKADKYIVKRNTRETGTYKTLATITGTSYVDKSASAGKHYYYKIIAVYEDNQEANSYPSTCKIRCTLARPEITVKSTAKGEISLSWKKVDGAAKYQIWQSTSKNGKYKKISTTTKLKYTNVSLISGKKYYYKVKAIHPTKSSANSAYSIVKSIKAK